MLIKVVKVGEVTSKEGKSGKPYKSFEFVYEADDRVGKKMLFPTDKVGKVLKDAKDGQEFDIKLEKNGEYWDWVGINTAEDVEKEPSKSNGQSTKAATPYKSTYETPEERARKQIYITRAVALGQAVALIDANPSSSGSPEEAIRIAKVFETYLFGQQEADLMIPEVE